MTLNELHKLLKKVNIPVVYGDFEDENNKPKPPYMTHRRDTDGAVHADDKVYAKIPHIILTLYQKKRNLKLEETVENLLTENNLVYETAEDYNYSEKLIETDYEFYI